MTTENLKGLEAKVDKLIAACDQLQAENRSLRERESALIKERGKLVEKNDAARSRVEAMITRLKNLEIDG
jgi:cell division protein ZapB